MRITALGRARLRRRGLLPGGAPSSPGGAATERDTGDVSASETVARAPAAAQAEVARDEAGRAAARRLGGILVRRLLGFPEPGDL